MPQTRDSLDRQLSQARQEMERYATVLKGRGVPAEEHRLDTQWRSLRAKCRRLETRLRAVRGVERRDADAVARKAEKAAAPPEPKVKAKAKGADKAEKGKKEKPAKEGSKKQPAAAEAG